MFPLHGDHSLTLEQPSPTPYLEINLSEIILRHGDCNSEHESTVKSNYFPPCLAPCDHWDIFSQLKPGSSLQHSEEEFTVFAKISWGVLKWPSASLSLFKGGVKKKIKRICLTSGTVTLGFFKQRWERYKTNLKQTNQRAIKKSYIRFFLLVDHGK